MMRFALTLAAALMANLCTSAHAQSAAGSDAFDFLTLDADARAVALGGAYTAAATDANALLYNPAGLGRVKVSEATFMHNQYAQGVTQQYIGVAMRQGFGFQFNYASLGDVPRTTISQPGGTGGKLNIGDTSLGAGYGKPLSDDLSVGVGAKYFQESLGDATANGWGLDFGGLYRMPELHGLTFGGALLNVGPAVKFASSSEKLPTTLRAGAAYAMRFPRRDVRLLFDLSKNLPDKVRMGLGAEAVMDAAFAVRLGFTTRRDAGVGLSLGMGWTGRNLGADYAFVPLGDLGSAHRLSFTLRWGPNNDPMQARAPEEGSPEYRLQQAQAAIDRGDYVAARSFLVVGLRQLGAGDRRRVRFQERLGSILVLQKDFRGAVQAYAEGVNLAYKSGYADESVADSYVGIGMCFTAGKNYADASRAFQKALAIGPSAASLQVAKAQLARLPSQPGADERP